jgi:hypothetical protein
VNIDRGLLKRIKWAEISQKCESEMKCLRPVLFCWRSQKQITNEDETAIADGETIKTPLRHSRRSGRGFWVSDWVPKFCLIFECRWRCRGKKKEYETGYHEKNYDGKKMHMKVIVNVQNEMNVKKSLEANMAMP